MKSIMFIAGEASGDSNAAAVIRALKARAPDLEIFGTGGPQIRAGRLGVRGDNSQFSLDDFSVTRVP